MCDYNTKRRLANLFCNKWNAIALLPSDVFSEQMVSSAVPLQHDRNVELLVFPAAKPARILIRLYLVSDCRGVHLGLLHMLIHISIN